MCLLNKNSRRAGDFRTLSGLLELSNFNDSFTIISQHNLRAHNQNETTNQSLRDQQPLSDLQGESGRNSSSSIGLTSTYQSDEQQEVFSQTFYLERKILNYFNRRLSDERIRCCLNCVIILLRSCSNFIKNMSDPHLSEQQDEVTGSSLERDSLLSDRYNQENHWYSRRVEQERRFVGNHANNDDIDEIFASNHETEIARNKLIRVLKLSVIFNAIITICHALLIVKTFDIEFFCYHLSLGRSLTMQNFRDKLGLFGCQQGSNTDDNESSLARLVAGSALGGKHNSIISNKYEVYYYFLIVSILDTLNNLFWYHSRKTLVPLHGVKHRGSRGIRDLHSSQIKFRLQQVTLSKSAILILTSPKQLFQVLSVSLLLTNIRTLRGSTGTVISLYNCINQAVRNLYNLIRVVCYLRKINTSSIISQDNNVLCLNESATTTYFDWQQSSSNNDIVDDRVTDIMNNHGHQEASYNSSSYLEELEDDDDERDRGWSRWPIDLYAYSCEQSNSLRYRFERMMMISQMICFKVTVFAMLCHIESQKSTGDSYEKIKIYFSLVESFLAMYFYYDKYYNRYMQQRQPVEP